MLAMRFRERMSQEPNVLQRYRHRHTSSALHQGGLLERLSGI
jgi:hypothetical protein